MSEGQRVPSRGTPEAAWPDEPLAAWEGYGIEIELMIVDAGTLDVRPVADRLMEAAADREGASDVSRGPIAWSNELALHVLELKTDGPVASLDGLDALFHANVREADERLAALGCRLLPGGMHPWMDPARELRLWPHEYTEVYRAFDRIFGCRGHGWANLQSTHLNLPFRGDDEFRRLHEAVRLVLPLVPALAASSPVLDGAPGPVLDNRLVAYRDNARRVPSVTGRVVPERVRSRAGYREEILDRIYRDMEPVDPEGILRDEWVNARGAIARFGRGSVEVRVVDAQECPRADVAVVAALVATVRRLAEGPLRADPEPDVDDDVLVGLLEATTRDGGEAPVGSPAYLDLFGMSAASGKTAGRDGRLGARDVWRHVLEAEALLEPRCPWSAALRTILERGTLAERLRSALGLPRRPGPGDEAPSRTRLREVYGHLAECLSEGTTFDGDG